MNDQLAECELNYARIMRLLPNMEEVDHCEFGVSLVSGNKTRFRLSVDERCKYTTMLSLSQLQTVMDWSQAPHFELRVYHDVLMAEVVSFHGHQSHRNLKPVYDYPNEKMLHCDEKAQLNRFLGEWLSYCLQYGYTLDASSKAGLCEITQP